MPKLTAAEQKEFLDTPGILMRIACVRADGSPLVTPIWFIHQEDAIYLTPRAQSEWFACLRHDARAALCIDDQNPPYRKIIVEGRAELVHDLGEDDAWRDLYRQIAKRYVPEEAANAYVDNTDDQPRGLYRVVLSDSVVKSWRMPVEGEPETGIWHQRYYAPGTRYSDQ